MPQNELARPHLSGILDIHQNSLRAWLAKSTNNTFSEDELKLHHAAALAYADPRRPSIRSLHAMLCNMLTRDSSLSGIALQHPTLASFRHLVLTLPDEFVNHMRMAARSTSGISSPMRDRRSMTSPVPARLL